MLSLNKKFVSCIGIIAAISFHMQTLTALQIGDGTAINRYTPVVVQGDVDQLICGTYNTIIIKKDGTAWVTGSNENHQIPGCTEAEIHSFIKIADDVIDAAIGWSTLLILKSDGSLYWAGEMIESYDTQRFTNGNVVYRGISKQSDSWELLDTNVAKLYRGSGSADFLYIKSDDSLWGIGENFDCKLGTGSKEPVTKPRHIMNNVKSVSITIRYSMVITNDNCLYIAGSCLFTGDSVKYQTFTKVAGDVIAASTGYILKTDHSVWKFGLPAPESEALTKIMDNVVAISSSYECGYFLTQDSKMFVMGGDTYNYFGMLGLGKKNRVDTPVLLLDGVSSFCAGSYHGGAILKDGTLVMMGMNRVEGLY